MDKTLSSTPVSNRTHIGFFGRMNAGKSSLINAIADQPVSIVSSEAGTTTDVVKKTMEIHGIGPCVLLDTAGFDDEGSLGEMRIKASDRAARSADIAVVMFSDDTDHEKELKWVRRFEQEDTPVIAVISHADRRNEKDNQELLAKVEAETGIRPLLVSSVTKAGICELKEALIGAAKRTPEKRFIMGNLVQEGDTVVLVMPQDPQAPEGRLIIPEVQTIRESLDRHCISVCVQPEDLPAALKRLKDAPDLIITDSQVFDKVYELKPERTRLTSFSVLFAGYKGDICYYTESVKAIDSLTGSSRVLIAECCTHAPMDEDIGRVKIPAMLRKRAGKDLTIDVTAGSDFPENLNDYDLVIQCGGCMFNRKYVCSRINRAKELGVPMTNYGITIAYLKGILDRVSTAN